jgi:hypothetical protein
MSQGAPTTFVSAKQSLPTKTIGQIFAYSVTSKQTIIDAGIPRETLPIEDEEKADINLAVLATNKSFYHEILPVSSNKTPSSGRREVSMRSSSESRVAWLTNIFKSMQRPFSAKEASVVGSHLVP